MTKPVEFKVNPKFMYLWKDRKRFEILKGGAGSSKSYSAFQYILSEFVSQVGCNVIVTRKVGRTLKVSVFALVKQLINKYGMTNDFKINNSDLFIRHLGTGNLMFFLGMDDPEKIKSITAENGVIEKVVMEELSEFDQADLDQLNARLRGRSKIKKQIIGLFNPISEEHWLKTAFWDEEQYEDARVSESTYRDNLFLDSDYKKVLEGYRVSNPYFYSVYCKGEWGSIDENDTIIPYHIAYAARYRKGVEPIGILKVGLDVARYGDDSSVAYIKRGLKVLGKRTVQSKDAKGVSDMVLALITMHRKGKNDKVVVNVDATGLGSGAVDMLNLITRKTPNTEIIEIHFGGKAEAEDIYINAATEMYFETGKLLAEAQLLEHDADVIPELTKRKYEVDWKTSRYKIEPKPDFKKRLTKSPDSADALVLAFYNGKGHNKTNNDMFNVLRGLKDGR